MSAIDRDQLAADLHTLAVAVAAGTQPVPAMDVVYDGAFRMRVVPRILHNLLCAWRVATPQDTDPVVLACAGCGLCYPRITEGGATR